MAQRKRFGTLKKATKQNLNNMPGGPGVYSLNSSSGSTQYIGKAKRSRPQDRIEEHKSEGDIPFQKFGYIPTQTQDDAIRLEKRLIRQRKPTYNKAGK